MKVRVVLFEGPRSADPPMNHGMFCASAFSVLPDASRPAMPFASGGKTGRLRSHPSGVLAAASIRFRSQARVLRPVRLEQLRPFAPNRAPRANSGGETLVCAVGNQKFRVLGPAVEAFREPDFFVAERLAMRFGGVLLVRAP